MDGTGAMEFGGRVLGSLWIVAGVLSASVAAAQPPEVRWTELVPDARFANGELGSSVAIQGDRIAVGSVGQGVWIFERSGGAWTQAQRITPPSDPMSTRFGLRAALDGDRLFIADAHYGSGELDNGALFTYTRGTDGLYAPDERIEDPSPLGSPLLGFSLAAAGGALVAGGPYYDRFGSGTTTGGVLYLLPDASGAFDPTDLARVARLRGPSMSQAHFGWTVAADATTLVVGQIGATNGGLAHVYDVATFPPTLRDTIPNPAPNAGDAFGLVALSADVIAVGAPYDDTNGDDTGAIYLFDRASLDLVDSFTGDDTLERLSAVGADGDWVIGGAPANILGGEGPREGHVYLYQRRAGAWVERARIPMPGGGTGANFGQYVAIQGHEIVVSALRASAGGLSVAGRAWVGVFGEADGVACTDDVECVSGQCSDGVCCERACDGACEACTEALTGMADGTCVTFAADTDPDDACSTDGCGTGVCDGAGACGVEPGCDAGPMEDAGTDGGASDGGSSADGGSVQDDGGTSLMDGGSQSDGGSSVETVPRPRLECTCRAAAPSTPGLGWSLLVALGALVWRRRRPTRVRRLALPLAMLLLVGSNAASAQETATESTDEGADDASDDATARAREHFTAGTAHYEAGRFAEAAAEFQQAYDLSHRPRLLHNIYLARRDMGDVAGAVEALRLFLTEEGELGAEDRATLLNRLRAMERSIGRAPTPEEGEESEGAGPEDAEESEGEAQSEGEAESEAATPAAAGASGGSDLQIGGYALLGVGGVGGILAAVFGALATQERDALYAMCTLGPSGDECPAALDTSPWVASFELDRGLMWASIGVGAAALASGAALLLAGMSGASSEDVEPTASCGPEGCVVGVHGTF